MMASRLAKAVFEACVEHVKQVCMAVGAVVLAFGAWSYFFMRDDFEKKPKTEGKK